MLCLEAMSCLVGLGTQKLRTLSMTDIMLLCGQTLVANLVLFICLNLTSNGILTETWIRGVSKFQI